MKNIISHQSRRLGAAVLSCALLLQPLQSAAMDSFNAAKKVLPSIYRQLDHPSTIYCGCPVSIERNRFVLDLKTCGYQVRKQAKRAARVEIEHVMPAWEFGHQLQCWQNGGRKQCATDARFAVMEGDLHNLFPAVGEVNGDRSNFQFSQWNATPYQYGKCEMVVDFKSRLAQPPERSRGVIARAYLYMADRYSIRLAPAQRRLYEAWDRTYAPDANECRRNVLITKQQGNDNPYVTARCRVR